MEASRILVTESEPDNSILAEEEKRIENDLLKLRD